MNVDRFTEMPTGAPSSPRKEEENKAIVDRWLTSFWGKDYDPAIVDELAAPNIFFLFVAIQFRVRSTRRRRSNK
jgi:hypothetical protein